MVGSEEGEGSEAEGGPDSSGDGSQGHCMDYGFTREVLFSDTHKLRRVEEVLSISYIYRSLMMMSGLWYANESLVPKW